MPPDVKVSASPSAGYPSGPANIQKTPHQRGFFFMASAGLSAAKSEQGFSQDRSLASSADGEHYERSVGDLSHGHAAPARRTGTSQRRCRGRLVQSEHMSSACRVSGMHCYLRQGSRVSAAVNLVRIPSDPCKRPYPVCPQQLGETTLCSHPEEDLLSRGSKPEPPKIPSADQRGLSRARSMG